MTHDYATRRDLELVRAPYSIKKQTPRKSRGLFHWSGLRGSNPPPPPWQGGALPNELNPHKWCLRSESNQRHEDFQSSALPTELQRRIGGFAWEWRLGWGSNPRPLAWQASALTNWATKPFSKRDFHLMVESTGLDSRANCALSHSRLWQLLTVIHYRSYFEPVCSLRTLCPIFILGGKYRARTCDPLLVRQMLSQLS